MAEHKTHWKTICSCGKVISWCGCNAPDRGEGPKRTIPNGCAKCQGMRPATAAEIAAIKRQAGG
jgi:hypothetical protein